MATTVLLPKQGNSVESCIIIEWKKRPGDTVAMGEPIAEVETDKATMEVESTADGVLLALLVGEGDDVPVLAPIAVVGEEGESIPEPEAVVAGDADGIPPTGAAAARGATVGGDAGGAVPGGAGKTADRATTRQGRRAISPRARKLADQMGVDFSRIGGSGPRGRIMVRDIEAALERGAGDTNSRTIPVSSPALAGEPQRVAAAAAAPVEEIRVTGGRRVIASRMLESLTTTAQFTMNTGADARQLLDYRARLKSSDEAELAAVSLNDMIMFAVSRVLPAYPEMNATFSDGVIRRYASVNLGFAVDTERGLMVPVVRNANSLSLVQLAAEAHRLAAACKAMKARPEELSGATFSITNLGVFGVRSFTPVLDPPQVGILGVGSVNPEPIMSGGETEFVPTLGLSLTIDHQVVDGAPAARFLQGLSRAIAQIDITLAK